MTHAKLKKSLVKKPPSLRCTERDIDHCKPGLARNALAVGLSTVLAGPALAAPEEEPIMLDTMSIEDRTIDTNPYAEPGAPYKAKVSGDRRHVKALSETPQTISVLTQTAIQESGKSDLRDILAAQPGISLGTGENGNAFGDRYVIRGHEARSDVFVDGLRDPGMTTRESFAVEQIEITKGPSSTFAGRGSTGGAVNSITKQASTEYSFNKVQGTAGTDEHRRATLDSNIKLSEHLAIRANLLHAYEEVPDRSPADRERNGIALSAAYQATEKLSLVADYYMLDAEDKPDLGSYISANGKPVKDIPVYLQDEDFLESEVDTLTFRVGYEINDRLRLENATRYGTTDNGYVVTGTRGGLTLSTHQGWQEVEYLANMTNLFFDTELGGKKHSFVATLEYTSHDVLNGTFATEATGATNCIANGRGGAAPAHCFVDDDGNYLSGLTTLLQRNISRSEWDSDYNIDTVSLAILDTIDLTDQLAVFLGLRADSFDYENAVRRGTTTDYDYSDTFVNGHAGVVYKISEAGNVYLTYSTSTNINGGESDVGGSCGYGGLCGDPTQVGDSDPEQTQNIELGTKWDLYDEKLLLAASVFQITKDDVMESVGDDYATLGTLNTGKNRVEGVEFSISGNVTDQLSIQAGAALMNAEVLDAFNSEDEGKTLANFADKSAFLQLRYQLTDDLSIGGSASYSSEVFVGQPDSAANEERGIPSYTVYDLFASYAISPQLKARLNVGNVTDKDYWLAAYRSGAFNYIGDRRNARFSLSYEF